MDSRLAYIARINTATGLLSAINAVKLHGGTFHPGELDAIKSRANAIGGAGLRDVLQAIEDART